MVLSNPQIYDLGAHHLRITEETIEITDHEESETVQLDHEESYRLYVSLHALFTQLAAEI